MENFQLEATCFYPKRSNADIHLTIEVIFQSINMMISKQVRFCVQTNTTLFSRYFTKAINLHLKHKLIKKPVPHSPTCRSFWSYFHLTQHLRARNKIQSHRRLWFQLWSAIFRPWHTKVKRWKKTFGGKSDRWCLDNV